MGSSSSLRFFMVGVVTTRRIGKWGVFVRNVLRKKMKIFKVRIFILFEYI